MNIKTKWIVWVINVISFIAALNAVINPKPMKPSQFGVDQKLIHNADSIISKQREERAMLRGL